MRPLSDEDVETAAQLLQKSGSRNALYVMLFSSALFIAAWVAFNFLTALIVGLTALLLEALATKIVLSVALLTISVESHRPAEKPAVVE